MAQLNGRVFTRLQQYDALPTELKDEAERLEQHLVSIQSEVFSSHRTMQLKSIYGVRTRALLEKIEAWVKEHSRVSNPSGASSITGTDQTLNQQHQDHDHQYDTGSLASKAQAMAHGKTHETHPVTPTPTPAKLNVDNYQHAPDSHTTHPTGTTGTTHSTHESHPTPVASNVGNFQIAGSATPATAPQTPVPTAQTTGYSDPTAGAHIPHAKQLLDALVLKGFVTPHKEEKPDDVPSATEDLELKDNELLVARANEVTEPMSNNASMTTVWDLVDGAVFAGMLKRKAGLLEPLTHGKDTYAMVNMRLRSLTLFSSDLGREPVVQMDASKLKVAFDKSHYEHGVKVWTGSDTELLNAPSASESDALVQALLAVGATQDQQAHHGHATTGATTTAEKLRDEVKQAVGSDSTKHHDHHDSHMSTADKHHSITGDKHQTGDARGSSMAPPADATRHQHHGWDTELKTTQGEQGLNTHTEKHGEHSGLMHGQGQEQMMPNQHQSGDFQSGNPLTHGEYPSHTTQQQQQHPMTGEAQMAFDSEDHTKRSDAPRGFSQMHEPTMTP